MSRLSTNEPSLVTSRHAASHGSPALALDPADARFPANPPHDTPHRFARALERLPSQPRARGGRPRHVHGCVPRPFTIVFSAVPKIFPICGFWRLPPIRSRSWYLGFFPESNERTVVFFVVSFFPRKNHPSSIFDVATDGEARPRVTNDTSALTRIWARRRRRRRTSRPRRASSGRETTTNLDYTRPGRTSLFCACNRKRRCT